MVLFFHYYKFALSFVIVKNVKLKELVKLNVIKLVHIICIPFSVVPSTMC